MSVALIATVVQQSDTGLAREDVAPNWPSAPLRLYPKDADVASDPEVEFAQWSVDGHLHKKQKKLDAINENDRPAAVVKNLVELRAVARLISTQAQDMLGTSSGNTATPTFLREFGKPAPTYHAPFAQIVDGIEQPVKYAPPPFNIVEFYSKAMAKTKAKFSGHKGLNKYMLDNLDAFIVSGHPVVVKLENQHYKMADRRGINRRALGLTMNPTYIMRLSARADHWSELVAEEYANARHADVAAAVHMLKAGAKNTYVSFLSRARQAEDKRMQAAHMKEVEIASAAIKNKFKTDSSSHTFKNIQMLPASAKKALEEAKSLVKRRSANSIRKEARDAAAKWVLDKKASTKNMVVENIKSSELSARAKSCQMRGKDRYCFLTTSHNYDVIPCCKNGVENGKHPCCGRA